MYHSLYSLKCIKQKVDFFFCFVLLCFILFYSAGGRNQSLTGTRQYSAAEIHTKDSANKTFCSLKNLMKNKILKVTVIQSY